MRASKLKSTQNVAPLTPVGAHRARRLRRLPAPDGVLRELVRRNRWGLTGVVHGNDADRFADAGRLAHCSGIGTVAPTPEPRRKIV